MELPFLKMDTDIFIQKKHELFTHMSNLIRAPYDISDSTLGQNGTPHGQNAGKLRMLDLCERKRGVPGTTQNGGCLYIRHPKDPDGYRLMHVPDGSPEAQAPSLPMATGLSSQLPSPPDAATQQRADGNPPYTPNQLQRIAGLALNLAALPQAQDRHSPKEKAEATRRPESPREPENSHNDNVSDHSLDGEPGSARAPINLEDEDEGAELIHFRRAGEHPDIPMPLVKDVSVLIPSVDEVLPSWPKPAMNELLDSFRAEFEEKNAG